MPVPPFVCTGDFVKCEERGQWGRTKSPRHGRSESVRRSIAAAARSLRGSLFASWKFGASGAGAYGVAIACWRSARQPESVARPGAPSSSGESAAPAPGTPAVPIYTCRVSRRSEVARDPTPPPQRERHTGAAAALVGRGRGASRRAALKREARSHVSGRAGKCPQRFPAPSTMPCDPRAWRCPGRSGAPDGCPPLWLVLGAAASGARVRAKGAFPASG